MYACLLRKAWADELLRKRAQLFRSLFSAVMCGALARAQKVQRLFGPLRLWPAYAVRGFPGAASMVFYYQAIAMLPLSDAVRCPSGCYMAQQRVLLRPVGTWTALHGPAILLRVRFGRRIRLDTPFAGWACEGSCSSLLLIAGLHNWQSGRARLCKCI